MIIKDQLIVLEGTIASEGLPGMYRGAFRLVFFEHTSIMSCDTKI